MNKIAVVGANGYVGSKILRELLALGKYDVFAVTRDNYSQMQEKEFDVLINSAMPSGKFWAKENPTLDFKETVEKTANLLYEWKFKKFIQISTVSARCQLDTVYGRHKASAEKLCHFGDNLIIRLGALYSDDMKKGVLLDLLQGKTVYADGKSRYSFISTDFCAQWIAKNIMNHGLVELGGKNAVTLEDVALSIEASVVFDGEITHLDVESSEDLPEAGEVLEFLKNIKYKK